MTPDQSSSTTEPMLAPTKNRFKPFLVLNAIGLLALGGLAWYTIQTNSPSANSSRGNSSTQSNSAPAITNDSQLQDASSSLDSVDLNSQDTLLNQSDSAAGSF
jgi:hypothetical protein